jgi:hypothetical protein
MKRSLVLLFIAFVATSASSQSVKDYASDKALSYMQESMKQDGLFRFAIVPISIESLVLDQYPRWLEKRFSKDRIITEVKNLVTKSKGKMVAFFFIKFVGDWMSKGKTDLTIPDDFSEYVFIEDDSGNYFPCTKAEVPIMESSVNMVNDTSQVVLEFSVDETMFANSTKLVFSIGGLDLPDKTFSFDLPLSSRFQDCATEIRDLFVSSGIWKE